jgi:hypothetical protein
MASASVSDRVTAAVQSVTSAAAAARVRIDATRTNMDGRTQADARRHAHGAVNTIERAAARWRAHGAALAAGPASESQLVKWEEVGALLVRQLDSTAALAEDASLGNVAWQTLAASFGDFGRGARVIVDGIASEGRATAAALRWGLALGLIVALSVGAYALVRRVAG